MLLPNPGAEPRMPTPRKPSPMCSSLRLRLPLYFAASLVLGCGDDPVADESTNGTTSASADGSDTLSTAPPSSSQGPTTSAATSDDGSSSAASTSDPSGADSSSTGDGTTSAADGRGPTVMLDTPRDGRMTPVAQTLLRGTVADDVGVVSVAVRGPGGDEAVELSATGGFETTVRLRPGDNQITVVATDAAGNETTHEVGVYFGHRVSIGNSQVAHLRDGTVHTWGRNELGQLGNGTLEGSAWGDDPDTATLPVRYEVDTQGLVSVVNRQTFMIAVRDDGAVVTWGSNRDGQLGYDAEEDCGSGGTSPCRRVPTEVPSIQDAIAVGPGFDHSLVLLEDGRVVSFGSNEYGQLGYTTPEPTSNTPALVPDLASIVQVAAGSDVSFALTSEGQVYAWGENDHGQLGTGSADDDAHSTPTPVVAVDGVVQVAAANTTAFALLANGTVVAWGRNHAGQVGSADESGDDVFAPSTVQVQRSPGVFEPLADVENVAGDGFVGMALTTGGEVYTWGFGFLGQLGQGLTDDGERDLENRFVASRVPLFDGRAPLNIAEVECGAGGPTMALSAEGDLFGWGWSFRGSLGLQGAIDAWAYTSPVLVFAAD